MGNTNSGASGANPEFAFADADNLAADTSIGIFTEDIATNANGYLTTFGLVRDLNTSGSLYGETWNDADRLYVGNTPGSLTNVRPTAAERAIFVGFVFRAHATEGVIGVYPLNVYFLDELSGVQITSVANGNTISWDAASSTWINNGPIVTEGKATVGSLAHATDDMLLETPANKTLLLEQPVYDDWQGELSSNQTLNPSAHIVFDDDEASTTFKTNCDTGDYVYMNPQMQHAWKMGTDIHPHLHWWQTTSAQPNWLIQYRWQRNGEAKTTAWTDLPLTVNSFTYTAGTLGQITNGANITPPSGYSISDIIQFRVIRDVANDSGEFAGAETGSVDADAVSFDYHYQIDTMGSRQEYIK